MDLAAHWQQATRQRPLILRREDRTRRVHYRRFTHRQWNTGHMDVYVWSAVRLQGKAEGEKTSLRKCIRALVEGKAPGQDELRAGLSLLVGRLLQTNTSSRFPDTPL
jgi:hypothetical protein